MKRLSVIDTAICLAVLAVASFTLVPAIARIQRTPAEAKCQANLQRIAEAMALYLEDNHLRYPTNRSWIGATVGPITSIVNLPDPTVLDLKFRYGITWVEGLYPYTKARAEATGQDVATFWRCPNASSATFPTNPTNQSCRVTIALNLCLVEQTKMIIRDNRNLMMLREMGRQCTSLLRPSNPSNMLPNGNYSYPPQYPFLNSSDTLKSNLPASEYLLHGNGSYIVFADGHVKHFTVDYYPIQKYLTAKRCWDASTQQWYNYYWASPATEEELRLNKTIAISP